MGYGMMHGFGGIGFGILGLGLIGMVIKLVVLLVIIYFVYTMWKRGMNHRYHHYESNRDAKEILAQRFARGEISEEDYQRMKNML